MRINVLSGLTGFAILAVFMPGCSFEEMDTPPEIGSLQQGIRTSALIAYCSSITVSAHKGLLLPSNVNYEAGPGLLSVRIDDNSPLPFNNYTGNIKIASLWKENAGIMSVLLTGTNLLGNLKIYGLYAVPIEEDPSGGIIRCVFASEDIIAGNGSDTILNLSTISGIFLSSRLGRLEKNEPDDPFAAVKQNVWIISCDRKGTPENVYDDEIIVNGGGQIAEVKDEAGGVIYHAMINTRLNHSLCSRNPVSGYALSQNFKTGGEPTVDLGNSLIRFHSQCDGKAHVELSSGKYSGYTDMDISLGL